MMSTSRTLFIFNKIGKTKLTSSPKILHNGKLLTPMMSIETMSTSLLKRLNIMLGSNSTSKSRMSARVLVRSPATTRNMTTGRPCTKMLSGLILSLAEQDLSLVRLTKYPIDLQARAHGIKQLVQKVKLETTGTGKVFKMEMLETGKSHSLRMVVVLDGTTTASTRTYLMLN